MKDLYRIKEIVQNQDVHTFVSKTSNSATVHEVIYRGHLMHVVYDKIRQLVKTVIPPSF